MDVYMICGYLLFFMIGISFVIMVAAYLWVFWGFLGLFGIFFSFLFGAWNYGIILGGNGEGFMIFRFFFSFMYRYRGHSFWLSVRVVLLFFLYMDVGTHRHLVFGVYLLFFCDDYVGSIPIYYDVSYFSLLINVISTLDLEAQSH
ncbi:hypothetical protein DFH27DRAFT_350834 [Peziza echinospora]|nr:hypothetical protein DFH27DRAFT_350834 [Peziza echinospora]